MPDINFDKLENDLKADEGFKQWPYDDANDARIVAGYTLRGTATIGFGFTYLTEPEAEYVLGLRSRQTASDLLRMAPWVGTISEPRQRALVDMAYNLGVSGLLKDFPTFISLMSSGQYEAAADDLKTTKWHGEVGQRAIRVEEQIRNG